MVHPLPSGSLSSEVKMPLNADRTHIRLGNMQLSENIEDVNRESSSQEGEF